MDENVFPVPPSFAKRQLDHMIEDAKRNLAQKGFSKEELDKKNSEFEGKFKDDAARRVRLLFILDDIARSEKIEVAESDIDNAYKAIAAQAGKPEAFVKEHYEKEGLVDNLEEKLREEKVIQFLLASAEIKEK
jgi:trigger factor